MSSFNKKSIFAVLAMILSVNSLEARILVGNEETYIADGIYDNNLSDANGGVFGVSKGGTLIVKGNSVFINNRHSVADRDGGAIYNTGTLNIESGALFAENEASWDGGAIFNGGVIYADGVSFLGNKAISHDANVAAAGALYQNGSATGTIKNSLFKENKVSAAGGAIDVIGQIVLEKNTFIGNEVTDVQNSYGIHETNDGGGALFLGSSSNTQVKENLFENNKSAVYGGAIATRRLEVDGNPKAKLDISNSTFTGNKAGYDGGAIYNTFKSSDNNADYVSISNTTFSNNTADRDGGAIYNADLGKIALNNVIFERNIAKGIFNDVHNLGEMKYSGSVHFDGGISGTGTTIFEKDTNLYAKVNFTTIDNIIKNEGATLNIILDDSNSGTYSLVLNPNNLDNEFTIADNLIFNISTTENKGTYRYAKKSSIEIVDNISYISDNKNDLKAGAAILIGGSETNNAQFNEIANNISALIQMGNPEDGKIAAEALNAMSPASAPVVSTITSQNTSQVIGAVSGRLSGGAISGSQGQASGDYNVGEVALWAQGLYNKSKLDRFDGFSSKSGGIGIGSEINLNDSFKIGLGYAFTRSDINPTSKDIDINNNTAMIYGEFKPNNWFINAIGTYTWSRYTESKHILGSKFEADYDVNSYVLQAMTGYDFEIDYFKLTPEVGIRYLNSDQKAYTDTLGSHMDKNNSELLTGLIGIKAMTTIETSTGYVFEPEARLGATYDFVNDGVVAGITLANGASYIVEGDALKRYATEVGIGVTAVIREDIRLSLGYEGKFRKNYKDHTGLLGLKWRF